MELEEEVESRMEVGGGGGHEVKGECEDGMVEGWIEGRWRMIQKKKKHMKEERERIRVGRGEEKKTRIKRVSGHWQEEEKRGRRKKYELKRKN